MIDKKEEILSVFEIEKGYYEVHHKTTDIEIIERFEDFDCLMECIEEILLSHEKQAL